MCSLCVGYFKLQLQICKLQIFFSLITEQDLAYKKKSYFENSNK